MDNKEELTINELLEQFIEDNAILKINDKIKVVFGTNDCNNSYYFTVINRRYALSVDDIVYHIARPGRYGGMISLFVAESIIRFENGVYFVNFKS